MLDYPAEIRPRLPLPRYKANVKQRELVVLLVILWLLLLAPFILYVSTPFLLFEGGRGLYVGRKFWNRFFYFPWFLPLTATLAKSEFFFAYL